MDAIPRDVALQLCAEIREKNRGKWYSFARMQCRGCMKFSKGNPDKMCVSSREDYRGCNLVNKLYNRKPKARS